MRFLKKAMVCVLMSVMTAGCVVVPIISGFRDMGATADSRRDLLQKAVKAFHDAMRSGNMTVALTFVDRDDNPELRKAIQKEMRSARDKEKVVDSIVDLIESDGEDYRVADVEVRSKFFRVPYFVVNEKLEVEKWEFRTIGSKWVLVSRKVEIIQNDE